MSDYKSATIPASFGDAKEQKKQKKKPVYVIRRNKVINNLINDQTMPVKDAAPSCEEARVSKLCEYGKLLTDFGVDTVYELFQQGVRLAGDKPFLGWKPAADSPYHWLTYREVAARVKAFGDGLVALGLDAWNETRIGLWSQNRPEYFIADQGFLLHSICPVPLYDTLGEEACNFIVNHADLSCIVVDTNKKVNDILDRRKEMPNVTMVLTMESVNENTITRCKEANVQVAQMADVEAFGKKNPMEPHPPKPDDLCLICFTSGTTGMPKGAMLSHRNMTSVVSAAYKTFQTSGVTISNEDIMISFLPLAHSYERVLEAIVMSVGGRIGFFQGDVKLLMDDIKELQPTLFPSVPRLLNRMYDKITEEVNKNGKIKKFLFRRAIKSKMKDLKKGLITNNSCWDKLAFKHVQASLGGKVRFISSGSAPISPAVLNFIRCVVGCPVVEGYGQTENTAIATFTLIGDSEPEHVGPPIPSLMVKLQDVPDMEYFSKDNKGEVCLRGANVFVGYFKDQKKTEEVLDRDGWLHTGDIGQWTSRGTLKIIDRKKNIFKLAQGEYIAPEKIENVLQQSPYLAQVYVHGDSLQSSVVAVVVPDMATLPGLCHNSKDSFSELCARSDVKASIMENIKSVGKAAGLSSLEQVKDIYVHTELFSVENDLLTPTFKLKRNEARKIFEKEIAQMYDNLNAAKAAANQKS